MFGVIGSLLTDWTKRSLTRACRYCSACVSVCSRLDQRSTVVSQTRRWRQRIAESGQGQSRYDLSSRRRTGFLDAACNEYHTLDIWTVIKQEGFFDHFAR